MFLPPDTTRRLDFLQLEEKLRNNEITKWELEPSHNVNSYAKFTDKQGLEYRAYIGYDSITNTIHPPLEKYPAPSLVRWDNTEKIFENGKENHYLPEILNGYSDHEIDGQVAQDYFNPIFERIKTFISLKDTHEYKIIDTDMDQDAALVKSWTNFDARIEFWDTNEGFGIIYGDRTSFLVVGIFGGHPFVETVDFTFDNSDGSTDANIDGPGMTLEQVKQVLLTDPIQYIFDQRH